VTVRKVCADCGAAFEAKRPQAKFCSPYCRVRAHRRPKAVPAGEMPPDPQYAVGQATLAALNLAGRADSPLGAAVLVLAARIDGSSGEPGTSVAALVREFRAAFAEAVKDARPVADPLDELKAKRDRRAAG
jgi:hypothetical protein